MKTRSILFMLLGIIFLLGVIMISFGRIGGIVLILLSVIVVAIEHWRMTSK